MRPELLSVRKLENGDHVVDLGRKWFRVHADGSVIARYPVQVVGEFVSAVKSRPATAKEAAFAHAEIAKAGAS